jgi:Domain of unknown function (DUF1841)
VIFSQDRHALRRRFIEAWHKARTGGVMEPLEVQIAEVVAEHPEYHGLLASADTALEKEYLPETGETNPFLHMALHIAVREQLATDRPAGIGYALHALLAAGAERHDAEHVMVECLAETLWTAQRAGQLPDENAYLERIRARLARPSRH